MGIMAVKILLGKVQTDRHGDEKPEARKEARPSRIAAAHGRWPGVVSPPPVRCPNPGPLKVTLEEQRSRVLADAPG